MTEQTEGLPPMPPTPKGIVTALDVAAAQGFGPAPATEPPKPSGSSLPLSEEREAAQVTEQNNPADSHEQRMIRERGPRLSLNAPSRKLEVPALPGYHLHWFLERNVPRALAGWYEYVTPDEVPTIDPTIAGRTAGSTSDDIGGGRISAIGGMTDSGQPEQLVLMKIRQEWYFDEQRKIAERNLSIIQQIFHKKAPIMAPEESQADYSKRYTREAVIDMSNGRFRKVD